MAETDGTFNGQVAGIRHKAFSSLEALRKGTMSRELSFYITEEQKSLWTGRTDFFTLLPNSPESNAGIYNVAQRSTSPSDDLSQGLFTLDPTKWPQWQYHWPICNPGKYQDIAVQDDDTDEYGPYKWTLNVNTAPIHTDSHFYMSYQNSKQTVDMQLFCITELLAIDTFTFNGKTLLTRQGNDFAPANGADKCKWLYKVTCTSVENPTICHIFYFAEEVQIDPEVSTRYHTPILSNENLKWTKLVFAPIEFYEPTKLAEPMMGTFIENEQSVTYEINFLS